jgi:hypothetical protein
MNAYSTLQVSSLQTWNVPQLNQSDGCGPTTIRYPNPVPSPHSSTAVASVTIPASDAAPYAISPETSPRDLTLRHNEIPNLDDIPDIAKEALRITKESLGSECQLLHQGMYPSIENTLARLRDVPETASAWNISFAGVTVCFPGAHFIPFFPFVEFWRRPIQSL